MMKIAGAAVAVMMLAGATQSHSGEAEIAAARSAIEGQLSAFRSDDARAAYGFAAPNIQRMFPTPERFMQMVTGAYPQVYRPSSYAFGKSGEREDGTVFQQVMVVGPDGKDYEAVYTLQRQQDGVFRITGVSLRGSAGMGV